VTVSFPRRTLLHGICLTPSEFPGTYRRCILSVNVCPEGIFFYFYETERTVRDINPFHAMYEISRSESLVLPFWRYVVELKHNQDDVKHAHRPISVI
jgi:hypothetical protein